MARQCYLLLSVLLAMSLSLDRSKLKLKIDCILNYQGDLFRGLGFRASGGGVGLARGVWSGFFLICVG
jgi:hypothetical protein